LTEEEQGGTAPEPEASASETDQAPEERVATVAVADEPASTDGADTMTTQRTSADTNGSSNGTVADETTGDEVAAEASPSNGVARAVAAADASAGDDEVEAVVTAPTTGDEVAASAAPTGSAVPAVEAAPTAEAAATDAVSDASADIDFADAPAGEAAAEDTADVGAAEAPAAEAATTSSLVEPPIETAAPEAPAAPAPAERPAPSGPEPTTMEELLAEQDSDIKSFKHGDVVEGNVVRIDKDEILVDIGAKSEGVVSNRELYGRNQETQAPLAIGDTVLGYVLQPESPEGHAVLSLRRAGLERKGRAMQEQFEAGVIIEAPVIDHNKGGLIVDCGIRGFVPISQIVDFPRRPQNDQPRDAAQEIAEKLQPYVGRKLRLKILEVNRKANRLILSEKVALYEERREKRDELFSSLQVGQKVTGSVRSIAPFGVFIDLGGIDGLVHKSELSWNKVNNPEAGYKVGDDVEAEVIDINHERGRISLSIRRLQPDPWHSTVADFKVGDIIDGTVTKLVNFGAFVRVRDGLEGLIHISELSHQRVAHPGDVVHEGQQLKLKIISLDSERHRLGLSLKQAEEPPARPAPEPGQPRERRPRGDRERERGFSMADAVQEPEGGIDNTLAAAFAQVRQQLAESETEPGSASGAATAEAPEAIAEPMVETTAAPAEPEAPTASQAPTAEEAVADTPTAEEELAERGEAGEPEIEAAAEAAEAVTAAVDTAESDTPQTVEAPESVADTAESAAAEAEPEAAAEANPPDEAEPEAAAEANPPDEAEPEAAAEANPPDEAGPEAAAEPNAPDEADVATVATGEPTAEADADTEPAAERAGEEPS
jgi:small subunit ribosomal protein S1